MKKPDFKKTIEEMPPEDVAASQRAFREMKLPRIDVLDFVYQDRTEVVYEFPELTAICPMTGLPDLYTVTIRYVPEKAVPELKSLRNYLLAFRAVPVLHEHLTCRIYEDFSKRVQPNELDVTLDVSVRGGIRTKVTRA